MYSRDQTLRHKTVNKLVRINTYAQTAPSVWAWNAGKRTPFISEKGREFFDDIRNYTHVEDEFGRPYVGSPKEGQFVDESAKKYLVSSSKLRRMRQASLLEWEQYILDRMDGRVNKHGLDVANKLVLCPFADGSHCMPVQKFFLRNRRARPLFKKYTKGGKWRPTNMVFEYNGQVWLYDVRMSELVVIKIGV